MERRDGLPLDGDLDELAGRIETRTVDYTKKSFVGTIPKRPETVLLDEDGKPILTGNTQKHHVNPSQHYNANSLLGLLAEATIDGQPLYNHRDFATNGLHLPTTEADAAKLGALEGVLGLGDGVLGSFLAANDYQSEFREVA